ncbi:MAG: transporter permease protein precursor [Hyphomicrobiales bacterium]|nr:transporter permease protein precursor [Hyphomicrobiales bacterium]
MTNSAGTARLRASAPIAPRQRAGRNGWIETLSLLAAALSVFTLLLVAAPQARAQGPGDLLVALTTDKFPDTERALTEIAASGLPTAPQIVEALAANRLWFNGPARKLYFTDEAGKVFDAANGLEAPDVSTGALKRVRLNNAVRRSLDAARGALTLMSPDPVRRRTAADSVFKSRDATALPLVEAALERETVASTRKVLEEARAAIIASDSGAPEVKRLESIEILKSRGDQDAVSVLTTVASWSEGRVKDAAGAASSTIQAKLALWRNVQNIWYGLSLGSVLLLAAIGLAITFGVMGIINMAHGEMVMLGAYTTFVVQEWARTSHPAMLNYALFIAIPLAFLFTAAVGILIERLVIRHLYGRPLETLLATFGISLILQQAVRTIFGANNREVSAPPFMSGSFDFGSLSIGYGRMWIIVFALAVFFALQFVLRATSFGLRMRAVTQNRRMASSMGIDTNRIDAMAFGLGSGIAGMAGVALSQIDNVSPNLGQSYIIDSFMVVVFGGVGNLWGTLLGAVTLGVANKFLEPIAGAVLGKILLLVFIILFIQKRPRGLFAQKGRAVEA